MNMNRILAAGLVAAVVSAPAMSSSPCRSGGWYVGAGAGVAFSKNKLSSSGKVLGDSQDASIKGNKTSPDFGILLGGDWRFNDVIVGVDFTAGIRPGKWRRNYYGWQVATGTPHDSSIDKDAVTVKNNWYLTLGPKIGYTITPEVEIYLIAGLKAGHYKVIYADVQPYDASDKQASTSAKKLKFSPYIGSEVLWNVTPDVFLKLGFSFDLKAKLKLPADLSLKSTSTDGGGNANSLKQSAYVLRVSAGYRF
ncbi:MAG: outer membrane beta-barrel protein [Holosporales bacterium]|jgi:opacity protein-like surface antigen|nr:outer membrane beta-barrel protein [Holosporales bacterium]